MFRTLDDLKGKNDKDKKDDKKNSKKQTESYIGGEKSGLAVENPDHPEEIVRRAREDAQDTGAGKSQNTCKITLYKQGFTINDGPIRFYSDPTNQKFMADLKNGHVPAELHAQFKGELDVDLEDKRSEEYKEPPAPKYIAYSGQGTSLGGAPTSTGVPTEHNVKAEPPKVDKSKPTTRIQIRLHDGKTQEIEVNLNTKVSEIFDYVWCLAPVSGEFQLIAGFPPQPITDVNRTVEEAGLEDSKVTQKLIYY